MVERISKRPPRFKARRAGVLHSIIILAGTLWPLMKGDRGCVSHHRAEEAHGVCLFPVISAPLWRCF
jgi:hypothetical protein